MLPNKQIKPVPLLMVTNLEIIGFKLIMFKYIFQEGKKG